MANSFLSVPQVTPPVKNRPNLSFSLGKASLTFDVQLNWFLLASLELSNLRPYSRSPDFQLDGMMVYL